jgi:hypothetical protein
MGNNEMWIVKQKKQTLVGEEKKEAFITSSFVQEEVGLGQMWDTVTKLEELYDSSTGPSNGSELI